MTVFCDTFALIAWVNRRDAAHDEVEEYFQTTTAKVITTEWVLVEFLDALAKPIFREAAAGLAQALRNDPQFEVVGYDSAIFEAGLRLYESRKDKEWSLTDCISFAVMIEHGLNEALTADHHFEQAGFVAIFKPT